MRQINSRLHRSILENIGHIFEAAVERSSDRHRTGGYLMVTDTRGNPILGMLVGEVPRLDKRKRYYRLAKEKCRRLARNPRHVCSWQSRNRKQEKFGGAIRANDECLIAFSGLPEEQLDEAIGTVLTAMSGDITPERIREIVRASHNPHIKKMLSGLPKK